MKDDKNIFKNTDTDKPKKKFWSYLPYIIVLIIIGLIIYFVFFYSTTNTINWSDFQKIIDNDSYKGTGKASVFFSGGMMIIDGSYMDNGTKKTFELIVPASEYYINLFGPADPGSAAAGYDIWVKINALFNQQISFSKPSNNSFWISFIFNLLPLLLIVGMGILFYRSMSKGKGMDFGISKNKAKLSASKVKFTDVAGYIEEKNELVEVVDFLSNPSRYSAMGARIPKGIILFGAPGSGKTLLAQAVAGEANVPFFNISGSDFVEMFVGLGAARVRELFKTAKKASPCIIFIDEIDTVGRQRGAGMGGGNDEREQTLNQLLVEMDGFDQNKGVVIIAATNRPDVLDPALLRPGRFDRQIQVHVPTLKEREAILIVHARNKNVSTKVDWTVIAKKTPGFSGAQLENVLNEAALLAVRNGKKVIEAKDIDESIDRVIAGLAKKSKVYTPKEKEIVAYHEAGHALIGIRLEDGDKVEKITIIPRGMAGGYTLLTPKEETFFVSKKALLERITSFLGGRAAEEIYFGAENITSGAHNDIEQVTNIARKMITELGMSELGLVRYEDKQENPFLGKDYSKVNASAQVAYEIDQKVKEIIDGCYIRAKKILNENKKVHKLLVDALLKWETIDAEQIEFIVKHEKLPEENKNDAEIEATIISGQTITFSPETNDKDLLNFGDSSFEEKSFKEAKPSKVKKGVKNEKRK